MRNDKKKKKWIRPRHKFFRVLLGGTLGVYARLKYNVKIDKFGDSSRPYLVLYNHQTAFDQFFVGLAFRQPIYYVASEDIFSLGAVSDIIKYLVAPIPIKKQTTDPRAVINCIKVAREGGSIAIAPEGNRTYSGKTEYIKSSIASLAKHLGLPIAFVLLRGGYGVHPRWSDTVRRGKMTVGVSRVVEPSEYKDMTEEELHELICRELYVDEGAVDGEYKGRHLAEYLERGIYVCPFCGLSEFESRGDILECKKCKRKVRYLPTKELEGVGFDLPFRFVTEWYDYQERFVSDLDLSAFSDDAFYCEEAELSEVLLYKRKSKISENARISLYKNRVKIEYRDGALDFPFDEIRSMAVLGKNKLNIYYSDKVYQVKGAKSFCALKYVNLYYSHKNVLKGVSNGKFLGL